MSEGRCFAADVESFAAEASFVEPPSELFIRFLASLDLGIGVLLPWTTGEGVFFPRETT